CTREMGHRDHVREAEQSMAWVNRLSSEHVETRTSKPPFKQRLVKSVFINERSARHVDQAGRRLHQSEPAGVHDVPSLSIEMQMERHVVAITNHSIQIFGLAGELEPVFTLLVRQNVENINSRNLHPKNPGPAGELPRAGAETDKAKTAITQFQSQ